MKSPVSVVITGVGCVTPLGRNEQALVAAMRAGITAIRPVALGNKLDLMMGKVSTVDFPPHPGDMTGDFTLAASKDAWQNSGIDMQSIDPWRVATIIGSSKGRMASFACTGTGGEATALDLYTFPGHTLGQEVAREMGFFGPLLNIPAACATGAVCIIRGIQSLQDNEADVVLAGSGEASATPLVMASFKNMGALSMSPMRPFSLDRTGFNPGEGAAVFVLEREDDARGRGAAILARIAGWDHRSDAWHITSADPSGTTVAYSIKRAITRAGWKPSEVEYINAHGTATLLNDLVESNAIRNGLFGSYPLVSSIKPFIGHLLGASSAVELALSLFCLRTGFVPPTPGLSLPDPAIPLHFVSPGGASLIIKRFLKLSLGFGGQIAVLALEIP